MRIMETTENDRKRPKTTLVFFIGILAALGLGFLGGRNSRRARLVERTDTLIIRDTFVDCRPVLKEIQTVRVDTVQLAVVNPSDTIIVHDTVKVEVPIMFSRYTGDDYDIGVRGFRTELEYVKVYPQTKIITNTAQPKRWGFGVAVGPSVLATPSGKVNAGLGVTGGVCYRF